MNWLQEGKEHSYDNAANVCKWQYENIWSLAHMIRKGSMRSRNISSSIIFSSRKCNMLLKSDDDKLQTI